MNAIELAKHLTDKPLPDLDDPEEQLIAERLVRIGTALLGAKTALSDARERLLSARLHSSASESYRLDREAFQIITRALTELYDNKEES